MVQLNEESAECGPDTRSLTRKGVLPRGIVFGEYDQSWRYGQRPPLVEARVAV